MFNVFVRTLNFHTVTWNGSLSHSRGERDLRNKVENIQVQSQYEGGDGQGQLEQTVNEEIRHVEESPLSARQELVIKVLEKEKTGRTSPSW